MAKNLLEDVIPDREALERYASYYYYYPKKEEPFVCKVCKRTFANIHAWVVHAKREHPEIHQYPQRYLKYYKD